MATRFRGFSRRDNTDKQSNSKQRPHVDFHARRSLSNDDRLSRYSPFRPTQWPSSPIPIPSSPCSTTSSSEVSSDLDHQFRGITMERTPSGRSIMSDTPTWYEQQPKHTLSDSQAARRVEEGMRRLPQHERILRNLIEREHTLIDDGHLQSIFTAADALFFGCRLSGRVRWEWSSHDRYQAETIGHTALRCCTDPGWSGFETLIVLSKPILKSGRYDPRLLLSAFLHELVHCYLFVMCGFDARSKGGHTKGFERIVKVIDGWVGKGNLGLCSFKADLELFRQKAPVDSHQPRVHYGFQRDAW